MAFFDDLGKKISQGSQSAVQKTKDMVEVAKLNSLISDEEKQWNNYCFQIGKLYVKIHRDQYEEEFASLMDALKKTEDKIVNYRKQVADLKGIIRCTKCGAEVPNTASFCNACGAPVAKPAPTPVLNQPVDTTLIMCSSCGSALDKNTRFCTTCGAPVGNGMPQVTPEQMPAQPAAVPEQSTGKRCTNCGAPVPDDLQFCTMCGVQQI